MRRFNLAQMFRALEGQDEQPILCVDFDGTIHSYEWGWQDGVIYGTVVPGFFEWVLRVTARFKVTVYSSRSKDPEKLATMRNWLTEQYQRWREQGVGPEQLPVDYTAEKPGAYLTIDDRSIRFEGKWDAAELQLDALNAFQPWTERQGDKDDG